MAATQEAPAASNFTFINRVSSIPLVADTASAAYSLVQSNSYSARAYETASGLGSAAIKRTQPIQNALQPQLVQVDQLASKGLDFVQNRYPYVMEARGDEVIAKARAPADQAYALAQTRAERIQAQLAKTLEMIKPLQDRLSANLHALSGPPSEAAARAQSATSGIVGEIEGLLSRVQSQAHELPAHIRTSLAPLQDKLAADYNSVTGELGRSDLTVKQKAESLLTFTRTEAVPLLSQALSSLREILGRKKEEIETTVETEVKS